MAPPYSAQKTAWLGPQRAFCTALCDPVTNTYLVWGGWDCAVPDVAGTLVCPFHVLLSPLGGLEGLWGAEQHGIRLGRVGMGTTVLPCPSVPIKSVLELKEQQRTLSTSQAAFVLSSRPCCWGLFRVSFAKSISIKKIFFLRPLHLTQYCLHEN